MTKKLSIIFVTLETICILILIGLLIVPKQAILDFANIKISIEKTK